MRIRWAPILLETALAALACLGPPRVRAQTSPEPPSPAQPVPNTPADSSASLDMVLKRLNELEQANRKLQKQVEETQKLRDDYRRLSQKYDELSRKLGSDTKIGAGGGAGAGRGTPSGSGDSGGDTPSTSPSGGGRQTQGPSQGVDGGTPSGSGGSGGGTSSGSSESGGDTSATSPSGGGRQTQGPSQEAGQDKTKIKFGPAYYDLVGDGFRLEDDDQEFLLRIRGMLQTDVRIYEQAGQKPVKSGLYLPRVRFYFDGHLTKPVEYQLSMQRGYSGFNVLNAYFNLNFDERFQFRVGRYKTPFTYEYYKYNNYRLLAPERSLFAVNFAGNRQLGLMGWGEMFDQRFEYNVGVFNGPRKSYQDYNESKDVMALVNFKPFLLNEGSVLQHLNLGGSVDSGYQGQGPDVPAVLRTSLNASSATLNSPSAANHASVPFLAFNNGVTEQGLRQLWDLHAALYYQGLSLLGAWDSGVESYARNGAFPVQVPVNGYFIQAAYIVTGETIKGPSLVDPIHPFSLKPGKFGLGAFEPTARFSSLSLGNQVFTYGLADPNLWTNNASMVDVGFNWYLNKFIKILFDWEHVMFGDPVYFAPGRFQKTSDLYWIRFQLHF